MRRIRYSYADVEAMMGVKGFDEDAIRLVLSIYPDGYREELSHDFERAELEDTPDERRDLDGKYECLKFWGYIPGRKLIEYGMDDGTITDPAISYSAIVYLIGDYVISARLNSHPMRRRNIFAAAYKKKPDSVWGQSVPELMEDIQRICNGCARALSDNMSMSAGPMVWAYVDQIPATENLTSVLPRKIWKFKTTPISGSTSRPPMGFFQPPNNVDGLLKLYDYYFKQASEVTGIPAYIYGSDNVGGAGKTASGLSMLMNAAAKGLKAVAGHLDQGIIKPSVREHWITIMLEDEQYAIGDINIIARASDHLVIAEQLQLRRIEYLQMTANPVDSQIIPPEGRAEIHRETVKSLKMPVDKIIPDREAIVQNTAEAKVKEMVVNLASQLGIQPEILYQMAMQPKQAGNKPQQVRPDGAPAGKVA